MRRSRALEGGMPGPRVAPERRVDHSGTGYEADRWAARILERQKMLQTDQVLLRRLSVSFALVLPFKDSQDSFRFDLLRSPATDSLRSIHGHLYL
jgi:hypothetical protein